MDMGKKVDLLIKGNLLVINNITGGGIFSTSLEQLEEHFGERFGSYTENCVVYAP